MDYATEGDYAVENWFFFYFFGVLKENEEIPNSALANPISF